jgi:signal transduction histidine kinase/CheY-like chemotaxis protein
LSAFKKRSGTNMPNTMGVLSRRFYKTQILSVGIILLIFTLLYIAVNGYRLRTQIDNRIEGISGLASTSLTSAVWQVDHASIRDFVDALFLDKNVVYVSVITDERNVIKRVRTPYRGMDFTDFAQDSGFLTRSVEIKKYSEWIGTFRVVVTLESIWFEVAVNAGISLILAVVLVSVISLTSIMFTRRKIFLRLTTLATTARSIADGNTDSPIEDTANDEIGELAGALEDMRHSLSSLILSLREANVKLRNQSATLEAEVKERTLELEKKNESLNTAQRDASEARLQAEQASRAKSEFLAGMSHEIRTPMNAIIGMAESLTETGLDETQLEYVDVLKHAGTSLLTLIDDILDLSRVESGRMDLENIDFRLKAVVERSVAQVRPKAAHKGLSLQSEISHDLPETLIGDPTRLGQVLINLLDNAIKFTPEGEVRISMHPSGEHGDMLLATVSDTGIGIPADKLESIFESFTQADGSTTRQFGGTGLGLSICRKLVKLMGGRIWAESEQGKGTSFFFTIPLRKSAAPPLREEAQSIEQPDLQPCRILLVEDSHYNTFVVQTYLKDTPCTVTEASNGQEGVEAFERDDFDLIIMDMQMPVMDGFTAMGTIRELERQNDLPRIPILAMTAHALAYEAERCITAGADMHLPKPVLKHQLIRAIHELCHRKQKPEENRAAENLPANDTPPEIQALAPRFLESMLMELGKCSPKAFSGDTEDLRRFLHKLEGEAGAFGFPDLDKRAKRLHRAARADDIETITALLPQLKVEMEQLLESVRKQQETSS